MLCCRLLPPKAAMEGEAQPAAASSDEEEVEQGEMEIDWPFDHTTTMCIPDLRTMCELPANAENEGVSTFRALFLPKGKTVHVPGQPGCYALILLRACNRGHYMTHSRNANGYMRVTCALHAHYMPCNAHVTPRKHYMTVTCALHAHYMRNLPLLRGQKSTELA